MEYKEIVSALEQGKTFEPMLELTTAIAKSLSQQFDQMNIAMLRDDVYALVDDKGKPQALAVLGSETEDSFLLPYGLGEAFAKSSVPSVSELPIIIVTASVRAANVREVIKADTEDDFHHGIKMLQGMAESSPSKFVLVSPPLYQDNDYYPSGYRTMILTDAAKTYQVASIPLDTGNRHTARKKLNQIKRAMAMVAKVYEPKNELKFGRMAFKQWPHVFSGKYSQDGLFDYLLRETAATYAQVVKDMEAAKSGSLN